MVRKYLEVETPREYVHIITGTWGTKLTMNEDNQGSWVISEYDETDRFLSK